MENVQTSGTLFDKTEYIIKWPRRYEDFDDNARWRIRDAVCARLADIECAEVDGEDYAEIAEELIKWHSHHDGYEIAKLLEDYHGWKISVSVVEDLDSLPNIINNAVRAEIANWSKANNIRLTCKIGDRVAWLDRWNHKAYSGDIVGIDGEHGEVTVFCEALGHVRTGVGSHGRILSVEQIQPYPEEKKDG